MATLGQFIRGMRRRERVSLAKIAARSQQLADDGSLDDSDIGKSTTYFSHIEQGKIQVERKFLGSLSQIYKIDIFLLLTYFYSTEKSHMVKLGTEDDYQEIGFEDYRLLTDKEIEIWPGEANYRHRLPKVRLANSQSTILYTRVEAGADRRPHSYAGEEIIRCESGEGVVYFPKALDDEKEKILNEGQIVHFDARAEHVIQNRSLEPAEFLIIRVLAPGSS